MIGRLFKLHSRKKHANSIAQYLPNDRTFLEKFNDDSELRRLIVGLAGELERVEYNISELYEQRDITKTTKLIDEWERALGIPDNCFPGTGTLEERRNHVLIKFTMSVQSAKDFERLGRLLGYDNIRVKPMAERAYPPYNVAFTPLSLPVSRFIAVVSGANVIPSVPPYDVPFTPSRGSSMLICLFDKLKASHTKFIYVEDNTAAWPNYQKWAERVRKCCNFGF